MNEHSKNKTILIIDDEPILRETYTFYLEDLGFKILTADNGKIGIELFDNENPDLVITDLRMPEVDGLQVLKYIQEKSSNTPVIVISGAGQIDDSVQALRFGAWDYILKPISDMAIILHSVELAFEKSYLITQNKLHEENLEKLVLERTSELQESNNLLLKSEIKYKTLFESSQDAIMLIKPHGEFIDANIAALKLFNIQNKNELYNLTPAILSPELQPIGQTSIKLVKKYLNLALENGDYSFEWIHQTSDSNTFPTLVHLKDVTIGNQQLIQATIRDITYQKEAEQKLVHSSKMDAIGQIASGVAHDFNNMICGISGIAQLIKNKNKDLDNKSKDLLDLILQTTDRATDLTSKLLAFSRKNSLITSDLDLNKIINDTTILLNRTIDKKIKITNSFDATNFTTIGNVSEIENIIINIGINASHALKNGGDINIKTKNIVLDDKYCKDSNYSLIPGEYIQIEIQDTGSGISTQDIKKIFEPFFTTKEEGKGTGLGLPAVVESIKNHKGELLVNSKIDVGTSFFVILPCFKTNVQVKNNMDTEITKGKGKILLVDDEKILRLTGGLFLKNMGYEVIEAENGRIALDIYKKEQDNIDLVIMDIIMPEMNGTDAYFKMKDINTDIKIIIASGYADSDEIQMLRKDGLKDFLPKPFREGELSDIVNKVLKR